MSWDSRYGSAVVGSDAINEEFAWIGRMCGADKASSNSVGSLGEYTNDYFANVFLPQHAIDYPYGTSRSYLGRMTAQKDLVSLPGSWLTFLCGGSSRRFGFG